MVIKTSLLSLLVSLIFNIICSAQYKGVNLQIALVGVVYDATTFRPIPNIIVTHQKSFLFTNNNGEFSMPCQRGDTLSFLSLKYKTLDYVIPDTLVRMEYLIGIFMSPDSLSIEEVLLVEPFLSNRKYVQSAQYTISGTVVPAFEDVAMDAKMNVQMVLEEYRLRVVDKGHVPTGFNIGSNSVRTYREFGLEPEDLNAYLLISRFERTMLKKLYYKEK